MMASYAILRRELYSLWITPLAWVLLCAFLLVNGFAFVASLASLSTAGTAGIDFGPLQAFYGQSVFVPIGYLLVCPLLSMRAFAEERRSGTAELWLSAPIGPAGVVLGKYLALAVTYVAMWLPTLLYPFILRETGQVEWLVVATSYFGVVGLGLGFLAVGVCVSAFANSQLVAALLSGAVIFLFVLCGVGEQIYSDGWLHECFGQFSVPSHLAECAQGILSLRRVAFALTLNLLPLFLATRAVDQWRDE